MKYIDAHLHILPERLMAAIFDYFDMRKEWYFPYRANVPEYLTHLRTSGMKKGFVLLYAHKRGMASNLNQWAYRLCFHNSDLVPFGCFHPDDENP